MSKEMQFKTLVHDLEVKEEGKDGKLHIRGYACAFNNIDSWGDIILDTALDDFLKSDEADRMKFCWQHNQSEVIGVITDKGVDAYGMWFEADIVDTTRGLDVIKLIKAGAINEFSIGYYTDEWHEGKVDGTYVRYLDSIRVAEVSLVTRAANPKAILLDAKGEDLKTGLKAMSDKDLEELKDAINEEYARRVLARI